MKIDKYIEIKISNCKGKVVVITGANSGIGFEASKVLAKKGATVVMACRNLNKANSARENILSEVPDANIEIMHYDQASLQSIKSFKENLLKIHPHIDAIVCNAGIYHPNKGQKTADGFPLTIGTNYLGLVYLIELLKDHLINTKIILVDSIASRFKKIKNYDFLVEENSPIFTQYAISKLAITKYYDYLSKNTDLDVYMMHPGVSSTNIFTSDGVSYAKWFKKIAKKLLPVFVHSPKKASLGISLLVANNNPKHLTLGPRGIFQISGYPKTIKVKKYLRRNSDVLYKNAIEVLKRGEANVKC